MKNKQSGFFQIIFIFIFSVTAFYLLKDNPEVIKAWKEVILPVFTFLINSFIFIVTFLINFIKGLIN